MLFVLTIGLVPVHCVDTYRVSAVGADADAVYTVTAMEGWVALFLMPIPDWHAGFGREPEPEIERMVLSGGQ